MNNHHAYSCMMKVLSSISCLESIRYSKRDLYINDAIILLDHSRDNQQLYFGKCLLPNFTPSIIKIINNLKVYLVKYDKMIKIAFLCLLGTINNNRCFFNQSP